LLRLQSALRDQGLYRGPVNGMMNTQTVMAIRAFQISIGKPSSGTLTGPEIVQLLNSR
jgi:peptidoglycan hydrolase-like protein with peptidoglycan-binding domain